ncbi:MAG: DUF4160 domain-containing protein [Pseudomonadota bacterium]|nr:DUF4160 domain-containing protein [Pseudomonadota bacterium]
MPTVAVVDGVAIRFYPDEHAPPHFHAVFAEHAAQIRIAPLEVLNGSLPASKLKAVLTWAGQNREGLMDAWLSLQAGRKPRRLP